MTFSFTLLINLFLGYTINRVTLFALILSLGLVVDDPIVDVENIHRHFTQRKAPPHRAVVEAVNEVRPPIILATLAVIISFLPMFFITGMMGTTWTGTSSPMDFNGLVRHYYLRQGANVADIRFNFIGKKYRSQQSHAIGLRLRNDLKSIAERYGANIKIVESPPGPPVISTLVAEVYGRIGQPYAELAQAAGRGRRLMEETPGVVDVDDVLVAPESKAVFRVDREKAALHGISELQIAGALQGTVDGSRVGALRLDTEVNPVHIMLRLPRADRARQEDLLQIMMRGQNGEGVFLSELGRFHDTVIDQPVYHKNLTPVVYVFGETAGLPPPEAVLALEDKVGDEPTLDGFRIVWSGEGEWDITLRVFRDLGIAFGVAVLGIYILLMYQTQSYLLPAIQLIALPLSVIGILPGFWILNLLTGHTVGGWENPVYFTAAAMIGMIALAGIATRNSILLIEFVEAQKAEGKPLIVSLIEAGALRTRPILLTSLAAMLAAWPITLDPIFSGLAWALIFGIAVSTFFTLIVVPVVYYMAYGGRSCAAGSGD